MNPRPNTDIINELKKFETSQLKELLKEAALYNTYTTEQQYYSQIYRLLSDLTYKYDPHYTMSMLVEDMLQEVSERVTKNILDK